MKKVYKIVHPDERLSFNEWAQHIHKELNTVRKKLGRLSYEGKK